MIHTLQNIFKITTSQTANRFIYYFKRIPLIGKILSDKIYQDNFLKIVISALIYIISLLGKFFSKALYLFVFIAAPFFVLTDMMPKEQFINAGIQIFICLSFIIGALQNPIALRKDRPKYMCVCLMGMRSADYCISVFLYENALFFITMLPSVLILSLIVKLSLVKCVFLLIMLMGARTAGMALHLMLFGKTNKIIHTKWWFALPLYGIFVSLAYLPLIPMYILNWEDTFVNPLGLLIALVIGGLSFYYVYRYPHYKKAVDLTSKRDELFIDTKQAMKQAVFATVKLKDSDLDIEKNKLIGINKKEGYDYLNAIFFRRHRRLLFNPILIRVGIVVGLFVILSIVLFFLPIEQKTMIGSTMFSSLNTFVFGMYILSTGDKMAKAMFFNCDISLLQYGFYRQKDVILKNFWIRLKKAILFNFIPATALCISLVGVLIQTKQSLDLYQLVPFLTSILGLSIFFSVHHLFLYYVFQPYTTDLDIKNPFFKIINGVVYMLCFVCLQIRTAPVFFVWIVLGLTLSYVIGALLLVRRFAPKTFRVK